jgi:hypothetical protein
MEHTCFHTKEEFKEVENAVQQTLISRAMRRQHGHIAGK